MPPLSASTQSLLIKAGWQPGRHIITLRYRLALSLEGYPWLPVVEKFLSEFGGLRITFPRYDGTDTFHFDAADAAAGIDVYWVQKNYAQRLGTDKLCVIGEAYGSHLLLFMSDTGKVYGGYDDILCFIASSGEEAIEAICQCKPTQDIPDLE
ncbi:SUKH-3 domain-containing protein [Hymenobacter chitinivorans]|uniref:SUKH-3 immunity protein of toxin-antitoxin system n=1 Tax=Hymenobacter chitinivorans DSM 11115 TaxID=1121954 RepID=A0A2M9B4P5_9BACT|nr:SUKH-3 domain-containing protein [Hymenobacter chitinivorans]PJJ52908.1 SUKH-3 immunity protein of toxin-antitoxin system [Hymenobacter chitinivorans DSM 11115]